MKTKSKIPWTAIVIFVAIFGVAYLVSVYKTNAQKEQELTDQILALNDDSVVVAYLNGAETNEIKRFVSAYCEEIISNTENAELFHIQGLEKSESTEEAVKFLLTPSTSITDGMYDAKTMNLALINANIKGLMYSETKNRRDMNSALWLFMIDPNLFLSKIRNTDFYPQKDKILKKLPEYCAIGRTNPKIIAEVTKICGDSAIAKNLGAFDSYLMKHNPQRLKRMYSHMDCYTFCSYYETAGLHERIKSINWGKSFFLKSYLPKSTAEDLAQLIHIDAIDQKTLAINMKGKLLKAEPAWE
ncbi:MAG: hypothetical protein WCO66_03580 [Candidatus Absconditabacteria bacterium]